MSSIRYENIHVQAGPGDAPVILGQLGACRFCGKCGRSNFRKRAHTFPESLGNKWIFSLDECDHCNEIFSLYEDALSKAVSPFLTLGGFRGKANKVRQTGRTAGDATISHSRILEKRNLSIRAKVQNLESTAKINPATGLLTLTFPIAKVPFVPLYAFKALAKMAMAMIPAPSLTHYQRYCSWLGSSVKAPAPTPLNVSLSFGSVGNAPPITCGTLLLPAAGAPDEAPAVFVYCAGSLCFQISFFNDKVDPLTVPPKVKLAFSAVLGASPQQQQITYVDHVSFDWNSIEANPQPVEAMILEFNPSTDEGRFTPIMRQRFN